MRVRSLFRLLPPVAIVVPIGVLAPATLAASSQVGTPIAAGPQTVTLQSGSQLIAVTFGTPINVPASSVGLGPATASGWVEQYAEVSDCYTVLGSCVWTATLSGTWAYNGSIAVTTNGPRCANTVIYCNIYGNAAQLPHNMTWWQYGYCYPALADYSIHIYFWGNGSHSVSVSGP